MVEKIEDETMADLHQLKDIGGLKQEIKRREYEIAMLKKSQVATTSSGSSSNWEHDVFLSFRGEDTRHGFTDHLYYAMDQRGIDTFRDTERLEIGKSISPELLKAIEESQFAVIVLSTNYATSTWCLDELAHILECNKLYGLEVLPVFYHVEPSEIRNQTGNYGKAFAKHETDSEEKMRKVNKWREALTEIANLAGQHVTKDRGESEVIREICKSISDRLNNMSSIPDRNLIGMDVRIEKMESYLDLRSNDVLSVGIWGMGGIGKTTLAREVFERIRNQFDISGFVSEVRRQSEGKDLIELQKLLCRSFSEGSNINIHTVGRGIRLLKKVLYKKKVLIVLDDVNELKQITHLAPGWQGEENSWGPGSRLIITTRDRRILKECEVSDDKIYEVEALSDAEAFQLMSQKAFKENYPPDEFVELLGSFVKYASGLPLAHHVLGSYLSGRNIYEWSETVDTLDEDPDTDIFSVLQVSYDGLKKDKVKKIFLDIACFFNGEDHVRVKRILKSCDFFPETGITDLINKSLIKIERKKLWMHDLLQQLGWHIVRRKSSVPGNRSRLWVSNAKKDKYSRSWLFEDACDVLRKNIGTMAVEGLFLSLPGKEEMPLGNDPFLTMPNLRLLKIYNVNFQYVHFRYVSENLRLLEWHECPLESLPSNFKSDKLVEFKMPNSRMKQLWNETLFLGLLLLMDLSNCQYLATTPDFSRVPNLERLILEGCTELSVVHPTIGNLQQLEFLNLKGCTSLESLPHSISLRSLRIFILSGCSKLKHFPEIVGNMYTLSELYLDGTAIRELPVSIQLLTGLVLLNLSGCRNLLSLPSVLCSSLTSLKFLYLSLCSSMDNLPDNIGCLEHLEELDVCNTAIRKVPESTFLLKNLKLLCFHGCSRFTGLELPNKFSGLTSLTTLNLGGCNLAQGAIPDDIGDLFSLQSLDLSENNFFTIPESISQLSQLTEISLFKCSKLRSLPKDLPSSLRNVNVRGCPMLTNSSSSWRRYPPQKGLSIINCRKPEEDEIFPELYKFRLGNLEELDLSYCQHLRKIPDLNGVPNLKILNVEGCEKLSEVHPTIGRLQRLIILNLKGCIKLESLPRFISSKSLKIFVLSGCSKLKEFPDIMGDMDNLSELHLDGTALKYLPIPTKHLKCPISINLRCCKNLSTVPVLLTLKSLNLSGCSRISKLPYGLESLKHLEELDVSETAITVISKSFTFLEKLKVLSFGGCIGLQLPNWFADLSFLTSLNLRRCGLAEEVLGILGGLSSLKILDLSENMFVTIPNDIGRLSSLHRLDLSGNNIVSIPHEIGHLSSFQQLDLSRNKIVSIPHEIGHLSSLQQLDLSRNKIVSIPDEIGHLSSLQQLDLSGNKIVSIPHEIGRLSSLQQLDLSGNNFASIPKSISHLSELTELRLFRCSKLQSLPNNLPFSLKHVYAQECPMLKYNADALTIRASGAGFCFLHCGKYEQDDDQPSHIPVPVPKDRIELLFPIYIEDRVYGKKPFEIRFPHGTRIPNLWSHWRSGPSVTIPLSDGNSACMGLALFVVFEILEKGNFNKISESEDTICEFQTDVGPENSLVFQNFIDFKAGSYALCCYEPRGGQLSGIFDKPSSTLRASVSTKRPNLKVRGCGIHLISEENAAEFVKSLANQTPTQHIDSNFDRPCEYILNEETITCDLKELESTSTFNEDSCSRSDSKIKLRGQLSILYEGRNGRENSFHLCVPAPIVSIPPWFLNHDAGDVTLCHITENLLDDQEWVGLELYVGFTRPASAVRHGSDSFFFNVDFCAYDHERIVMHQSLEINSCLGTSDQLVVLHVPRIHFQQHWNQCKGITALFRTINPEMEAQMCGSRLAFKHDLEDLTKSLTEVAGMLGKHVRTQIRSLGQRNAVEAEMPINCRSWFRRSAPAPSSSKVRLQHHRCYIQQQQGFVESDLSQLRSVMLLHSRGLLFENKDRNQEIVAEEERTLLLPRHHVRIMAETQLSRSYSSEQWKRCFKLLLRQSKVATLSLGGHTVSAFKNLDPYNIIWFSDKEIAVWFKREPSYQVSSGSSVALPLNLHDVDSWRGLAIRAAFEVNDEGTMASPVNLLCHLRAEDYCLNPMPMCSVTIKKLKSLHLRRFIWLTYIPRFLLTELNVVNYVVARIYVSSPGLRVDSCGIRLLYGREESEFNSLVTESWTSFVDNSHLPLIRRLVEADNQNVRPRTRHELPMPGGNIKVFDSDLIYNAISPSIEIPEWFGHHTGDIRSVGRCEFQLPSLSANNWIGLAICATFFIFDWDKFLEPLDFKIKLETENNRLSSSHRYRMTNEDFASHQLRPGRYIWLSYIPRRSFLHPLNGESVLIASPKSSRLLYLVRHRFVYAHDVEVFKQLCFDLHRPPAQQ